jgi:hypothetical protein
MMKNLMYKLPLILLAIGLISLNSCIDIDRKIKINADGSGTETQNFNIDRTFYDLIFSMVNSMDSTKSKGVKDSLYNHEDMLGKIRENLSKQEGIEIVDLTGTTNADSSTTYKFTYNFNKVEKIGYATNISPKELSGEEKNKSDVVWKDNGNKINFSLLYKPNSDTENSNDENNKAFAYLFANKNINFEIEFPYDIESCNAKNFSGKIGTWAFPLTELMKNKDNKLYLEATLVK